MDNMSNIEAAQEWHEYAERDLNSAKYLLDMRPVPLEIIAYHCEQCVEKYLKSYLVYQNQDIEKTHDLIKICHSCAKFEKDFLTLESKCYVLFSYVTDTRYPSMNLQLTDYDVKKALEYAEEIKEFVLKNIHIP